jgi:hypothetical protein
MKNIIIAVLLSIVFSGLLFGQDTTRVRGKPAELQQVKPVTAPADSLKQKDVFVDRDGDGINDLLTRRSWMRMGRFRKGSAGTSDGTEQKDGSRFGPGQEQGNPDSSGPKQRTERRGRK